LIPAQPQDINVGNVAYSKTDPDLIAFNVIDQTASDVWIANFETGDLFPLNIPGVSFNGNAIVDGDRPSFSPEDRYLCFTSADNSAMCYFDGSNGQVILQTFTQAV